METQEQKRIINRHIAKLLCDIESLCHGFPSLAKVAVKREMRFLASDIIENVKNGNVGVTENGYQDKYDIS